MGNLFNLVIFGKKFKEGKTSDFNQKCVADHCFFLIVISRIIDL